MDEDGQRGSLPGPQRWRESWGKERELGGRRRKGKTETEGAGEHPLSTAKEFVCRTFLKLLRIRVTLFAYGGGESQQAS